MVEKNLNLLILFYFNKVLTGILKKHLIQHINLNIFTLIIFKKDKNAI